MAFELRRKTFASAIRRMKIFVNSDEFMKSNATKLSEKLLLLRQSHRDFVTEHLNVLEIIDESKFVPQNEYFLGIQDLYYSLAVRFSDRIEILRAKECANESGAIELEKIEDEATDTEEKDEDLRERIERNRAAIALNDHRIKIAQQKKREVKCNFCSENHPMHRCTAFLRLSVRLRREKVHSLKLCENCFLPSPNGRNHRCKAGPCKRCRKGERHNSLLCYA